MVAAFGRLGDLRQAREAFAIRDARSAISNRLADALSVFQNSGVVEKYLRLFGNAFHLSFHRIEIRGRGGGVGRVLGVG